MDRPETLAEKALFQYWDTGRMTLHSSVLDNTRIEGDRVFLRFSDLSILTWGPDQKMTTGTARSNS